MLLAGARLWPPQPQGTNGRGEYGSVCAWMRRGWLCLLVPFAALLELGAYLFFSRRAPEAEEWTAVVEPVRALLEPGDSISVAPSWAAPLARKALGDQLWPIQEAARASYDSTARVVEISILGHTQPAFEHWKLLHQEQYDDFRLSVRKNPNYARPLFQVVEAIAKGEGEAFRLHAGTRYECHYDEDARPATGGLHGHVAFPRRRFVCGQRAAEFVGVTIVDDHAYLPRRCVWAQPAREGDLWLRFENVPFGRALRGQAGHSHFLLRDGAGPSVVLTAFINGEAIGNFVHRAGESWVPFQLSTQSFTGTRGRLEFRITSDAREPRHFCFAAETL